MPSTIREQSLEAFKAALGNNGGAFKVKRNAGDALTVADAPAVDMVDGGQKSDEQVFGETAYVLRVRVFGYARAANGDALGAAISDLDGQVVKAALADRYLGGLVDWVREAPDSLDDPDVNHDGARPHAHLVKHFEIEFRTKAGDPFSAP